MTAGGQVIKCERMLRVSVDAHQTSFVVMFFAEYLHQEVMFPLSLLHLADKGCLLLSTKSYTKDLKGKAFNGGLTVHFTALIPSAGTVLTVAGLPGWRVCCDAEGMTWHEVCPPAAFAAPTSVPEHGGRYKGVAALPAAEGEAHSPLLSLRREMIKNMIKCALK